MKGMEQKTGGYLYPQGVGRWGGALVAFLTIGVWLNAANNRQPLQLTEWMHPLKELFGLQEKGAADTAEKSPVACSLSISKVSVGDCHNFYPTDTVSKVLVAVFVDWTEAPAGEVIEVTLGTEMKTLNPATPGIPNFVQFIIPTDGSTQNVSAQFSGGSCIATPTTVDLPEPCPVPQCGDPGSIGGRVFFDFNSNGKIEPSEYGLKDVTVKLYDDRDSLLCSTTTKTNGYWACYDLEDSTRVRVEFEVLPGFFGAKSGAQSGALTQFSLVGNCETNAGFYTVKDFVDEDPWMATTCFGRGDPIVTGSTVANEPTLVVNRYLTPTDGRGITGPNGNYYLAKASETGTVWGLAYQRETKKIFSSAILRRHSGLGSEGLGGIYVTSLDTFLNNPSANAASGYRYYGQTVPLLNLDSFEINTGDEEMLDRDLAGNANLTHDSTVFDLVGKWGLGDMDINSAGDTLFVVNLYSKSLVAINIGNPLVMPVPMSNVTEIPLPDPGCYKGQWRPWALEYHEGVVYVGGVCSSEDTTAATRDLRAIIYSYVDVRLPRCWIFH